MIIYLIEIEYWHGGRGIHTFDDSMISYASAFHRAGEFYDRIAGKLGDTMLSVKLFHIDTKGPSISTIASKAAKKHE